MFFFCILSRIYFRTRMGNMDKVQPVKQKSAERIAHHRHFSLTLDDDAVEEICANNIITAVASIERENDSPMTKLQITDIDNVSDFKTKDSVAVDIANHNHVAPKVPVQQPKTDNIATLMVNNDNITAMMNRSDNAVTPVMMKQKNVAPVTIKTDNIAPANPSCLVKKENIAPPPMNRGRLKKQNVTPVPIIAVPVPIITVPVPSVNTVNVTPVPIIAPVPIIKNNVATPGQVKKTRFMMPVLDSSSSDEGDSGAS